MCDGCTTFCLQFAAGVRIFEGFADEAEVDGSICVSTWTGDCSCASLHVSLEVNVIVVVIQCGVVTLKSSHLIYCHLV